jgi:hypothetical protein
MQYDAVYAHVHIRSRSKVIYMVLVMIRKSIIQETEEERGAIE